MGERSDQPGSSVPRSSSSSSSPPAERPPVYNSPSSIRPPTAGDTLHPLFAPIGQHHALHPHATSSSGPAQPVQIPEKCLTFCSQRADAPPMCRMFCLRRRPRQLDRAEELARFRPRTMRPRSDALEEDPSSSSASASASTPSTSSASTSTSSSVLAGLAYPFHALARAVDPYSIIYVRGTPDGVVGRYMEEMEFDDGNRDFGNSISRHGEQKGRSEKEMEYMSWGNEGALLHLPLTSIFRPVTSIPSTLSFLLTPSYNMVNRYIASWSDGTQTRGARSLFDAAYNLDAITFWGRIWDHHNVLVQRKVEKQAKLRAEVEATRAQERARQAEVKERVQSSVREMQIAQSVKGETEGFKVSEQDTARHEAEQTRYKQEIDRLKSGSEGSSLRRTIEEAMERDEEFRRRKAAEGSVGAASRSSGAGGNGGNQADE